MTCIKPSCRMLALAFLSALCLTSCGTPAQTTRSLPENVTPSSVGGYLVSRKVTEMDAAYGGGYSMYANVYPLLAEYPGREFQSGLFGTWMFARNDPEPEGEHYSDIEGGLGWWRDTEFATETPKFIMGGVQLNFYGWANGPGAGQGRDWSKPRGHYGVAQLSPWLLWPPDGLNMKQGSCNELLGSGYLPLPLTEPKATTAGRDIPTGNQCWTLFLNTRNFKGPVAFFTPYFWSETYLLAPRYSGKFLDQRPSDPNKAFQQETQHIQAYEATDAKGDRYARMARTQYPVDGRGYTNLLHRVMVYKRAALWDRVERWFNGGPVADTRIDAEQAAMESFDSVVWSNWQFHSPGLKQERRADLNVTEFMDYGVTDSATFRLTWRGDLVRKVRTGGHTMAVLPEYYKWVRRDEADTTGRWVAIDEADVPKETNLHKVRFRNTTPRNTMPYVTPIDDPESCWRKPGPKAGPFKARLGDGSTITYYWYRFCEQPALMNADLTDAEREEMQRRVELLHRHWTRDKEYLPAPFEGELTEIDPALIVTPPPGMEAGYVPIVTSQGIE